MAFLSLTRSLTHLRRRNRYPFLSYGTQFPIPASIAYSHPDKEREREGQLHRRELRSLEMVGYWTPVRNKGPQDLHTHLSTFIVNSSAHVNLPVLFPQPALGTLQIISSQLLLTLAIVLLDWVSSLTHTHSSNVLWHVIVYSNAAVVKSTHHIVPVRLALIWPAGEGVAGLVLIDLFLPLITLLIHIKHSTVGNIKWKLARDLQTTHPLTYYPCNCTVCHIPEFCLLEPRSFPLPASRWHKGLHGLLDLAFGIGPVWACQSCRTPVTQDAGLILILEHTGNITPCHLLNLNCVPSSTHCIHI